jgi:hypothetical protein
MKALDTDRPTAASGTRAREGTSYVSSDYLDQQPRSEVNKLLDAMCADRVHEGPRWWEEDGAKEMGVNIYNGRDE